MAVDSFSPTDGHPIFLDTGAPDLAVDPTKVAEYAADVGNRIIRADLATLNAYAYKRKGLRGVALDTLTEYLHDGTSWVAQSGDSGWIAPTYANGWVDAAASEAGGYRKLNGVVYHKGRVALGTAGTGYTLPAGFRPIQIMRVTVPSAISATQTTVTINTNGTVVLAAGVEPNLSALPPFPAA